MDKRGTLAIVVIVAAVAIGAAVLIAIPRLQPQETDIAQTQEPGLLEGLEKEQSGDAVAGNQPSDEATSNAETPSPDTEQFPDTGGSSAASNTTTGPGSGSTEDTSGSSGTPVSPSQ